MDKALVNSKMGIPTKEKSSMVSCTARVTSGGLTALSTKENSQPMKSLATDVTSGQMARITMVKSKTVSDTEKVLTTTMRKEFYTRAPGWME